jgi:hypothetical protein
MKPTVKKLFTYKSRSSKKALTKVLGGRLSCARGEVEEDELIIPKVDRDRAVNPNKFT